MTGKGSRMLRTSGGAPGARLSWLPLRVATTAAVGAAALLLAGCTATLSIDAAPDANNPACAEVSVRLPDDLGDGLTKRSTNAQATGAWGDPAAVILRCGVQQQGVATAQCVTVGDVDWLVDDSQAPVYRFTTFGRTPATEVTIDSQRAAGNTALATLAGPVDRIPATAHCQ